MSLTPCTNFSRANDQDYSSLESLFNTPYLYFASQERRWRNERQTPSKFEEKLRQIREEHPTWPPFSYKTTLFYNKHTVLHEAALQNNVKLIVHFVKQGGQEILDVGNSYGLTPLYCAVTNGHVQATKILLRLGANPNIYAINEDPEAKRIYSDVTPLYQTLGKHIDNKLAIMKLLLRNRAQIHPGTPLKDWQEEILQIARNQASAPAALTFCWEQLGLRNDPADTASAPSDQLELDALPREVVERIDLMA